eukprot:4352236-Amphidinium_carterae.1
MAQVCTDQEHHYLATLASVRGVVLRLFVPSYTCAAERFRLNTVRQVRHTIARWILGISRSLGSFLCVPFDAQPDPSSESTTCTYGLHVSLIGAATEFWPNIADDDVRPCVVGQCRCLHGVASLDSAYFQNRFEHFVHQATAT